MDFERLRASIPEDIELVLGELEQTLPRWMARNTNKPLGYAVIDTDYYSSAVDALRILEGTTERYLPYVVMYLDDIMFDEHNSYCGELLAVSEFNDRSKYRKIERPLFIDEHRAFSRAPWLRHMFFCQILDHPHRQPGYRNSTVAVLDNPYL